MSTKDWEEWRDLLIQLTLEKRDKVARDPRTPIRLSPFKGMAPTTSSPTKKSFVRGNARRT